jgi:ubiquinone/menaquinone biosynthesis C-methylase UbiE
MNISEKELIEVNFYKESKEECSGSESVNNILNKFTDAYIFYDLINTYKYIFDKSRTILEIGAGQGWASCLVKKCYPNSYVVATDISEYAVKCVPDWEKRYAIEIDTFFHCKSYKIPLEDDSFDLIFTYSSAHHFVLMKETIEEAYRLLKKKGSLMFLYEPSTPKLFYKVAKQRVNKNRPEVPEDLLIVRDLRKYALEVGFSFHVNHYPSHFKRGPLETVYYLALSKLKFLQKIFPCTVNIIFTK